MTGDAARVSCRNRLEPFVAVEASLPRPGSPAAAGEEPEDDEDEGEGGAAHEAPCRQPDDFSGASPAAFAASSVLFGALVRSCFLSHSCSASFISLHHLKWWL